MKKLVSPVDPSSSRSYASVSKLQRNSRSVNLISSANLILLTSVLAGCGQIGDIPPIDQSPKVLNALTLNDVAGKVIDGLKNTKLSKYTGVEDLEKYDMLIVDGDSSNAEEIKNHNLVKKALKLHKPLLFVDVKENHKRDGIGKLIGFNTKGTSDGYMVIPVQQKTGQNFYDIYTTSDRKALRSSQGLLAGSRDSRSESVEVNDTHFAQSIPDKIKASQQYSIKSQDINTNIQPVQQKWILHDQFPFNPGTTGYGLTGQSSYADTRITYTLFQDLSTNIAQGGTQYLVVSTDASVDPGNMISNSIIERGWFTGNVYIQNKFTNDFGGMQYDSSGPNTANQDSSYESGTTFNIGLDSDGPSAGFTWSNSHTYSIPDWSVTGALGADNLTSWRFKSTNPDIDDSCTYGLNCAWYSSLDSWVTSPNNLSTSLSNYHTEAVYHNSSVSNSVISLEAQVIYYLHNFYYVDGFSNNYRNLTYGIGGEYAVNFDLNSIIPQQPNIIFESSTVSTNANTQGTISLPNPAVGDAVVYLKGVGTSNTGITIPAQVVIPSGESSVKFPISINNDQTSTSITIQANYGQYSQQAILKVMQN